MIDPFTKKKKKNVFEEVKARAEQRTNIPPTPIPSVKFNQDDTIDVSTATGKSFNLSKENYNILQDIQMGKAKPGSGFAGNELLAEQQKKPLTPEQQRAINEVGLLVPSPSEGFMKDEGIVGATATGLAAVGGAKAGASLGSLGGPIGTGVGAAAGALGAVATKMTFQAKQDVKNANVLYKNAKANMGDIITAVNQGLLSPAQAVIAFNEAKADIMLAHMYLKQLTDDDLNRFLSGGLDELTALETWTRVNIPIAEQELMLAIANPNPAAVTNFRELEALT